VSISKSLRFEVFARDEFTCQYCGKRPPAVVLECDHVFPRSKGGSDDSVNLITACEDCNRGKSARVLREFAPRPDADLAMLKLQQEALEIERFLKAKAERDRVVAAACRSLQADWCKYLTDKFHPTERVLVPWIERYGVEEIHKSIIAASPAYAKNRFGYDEDRAFDKLLKYVGAILRNRSDDREMGVLQ
jgi:hypothetical protein